MGCAAVGCVAADNRVCWAPRTQYIGVVGDVRWTPLEAATAPPPTETGVCACVQLTFVDGAGQGSCFGVLLWFVLLWKKVESGVIDEVLVDEEGGEECENRWDAPCRPQWDRRRRHKRRGGKTRQISASCIPLPRGDVMCVCSSP